MCITPEVSVISRIESYGQLSRSNDGLQTELRRQIGPTVLPQGESLRTTKF